MRRCRACAKVAAFLVSKPQDVTYLTGFSGEDSILLTAPRWACLVTDGRYSEQAAVECTDLEIHIRKGPLLDAVADILKKRKVRSLAIQGGHMTVDARSSLASKLPSRRIREVREVVSALRIVKDAEEIKTIRKAIRVAERAFKMLLAGGAKGFVGRSERAIAALLDYNMRLEGAEEPAFETIVAAGKHGSLPHYRPGASVIRFGQAVLIDWGARVKGYCSDLTRVVFVGRIPPKIAAVYDIVLRGQRAGIAAIRPGVAGGSVDRSARAVIDRAGYGREFVHGLGHGIGLEIHEGPTLGQSAGGRLRSGMVVTVEPGIYIPGVGGVRIEDDVLVVPGGRRRLSTLPHSASAMVVR